MEIKFAFSGKWHLHQCILQDTREVLKAGIPDLIRRNSKVLHNPFERKNLWKLSEKPEFLKGMY